MSKFRYPKCPYCGEEYVDKLGEPELYRLTAYSWLDKEKVRCRSCGEPFCVTVKIMYYGKKLK